MPKKIVALPKEDLLNFSIYGLDNARDPSDVLSKFRDKTVRDRFRAEPESRKVEFVYRLLDRGFTSVVDALLNPKLLKVQRKLARDITAPFITKDHIAGRKENGISSMMRAIINQNDRVVRLLLKNYKIRTSVALDHDTIRRDRTGSVKSVDKGDTELDLACKYSTPSVLDTVLSHCYESLEIYRYNQPSPSFHISKRKPNIQDVFFGHQTVFRIMSHSLTNILALPEFDQKVALFSIASGPYALSKKGLEMVDQLIFSITRAYDKPLAHLVDPTGKGVYFYAAQYKFTESKAQYYLENGAVLAPTKDNTYLLLPDINDETKKSDVSIALSAGSTPFHVAAAFGQMEWLYH